MSKQHQPDEKLDVGIKSKLKDRHRQLVVNVHHAARPDGDARLSSAVGILLRAASRNTALAEEDTIPSLESPLLRRRSRCKQTPADSMQWTAKPHIKQKIPCIAELTPSDPKVKKS